MQQNLFLRKSIAAFSLLFLILSCSKDNEPRPINYYFRGTINNVNADLLVEDQEDGDVHALSVETTVRFPDQTPNPTYFFTEKALGSYISDSRTGGYKILRVYVVKKLPEFYTPAERSDMIHLGVYPFGKHAQNSFGLIEEGGVVWFTDPNGVDWYSERGANSSPTDNFEVIERISWAEENAQALWKVKINCNLYNDSGSSIRISGEFRAQVIVP